MFRRDFHGDGKALTGGWRRSEDVLFESFDELLAVLRTKLSDDGYEAVQEVTRPGQAPSH